jgi:hypothetical protein
MDVPLSGADSSSSHSSIWKLFGKNLPRNEIVFFSQVILIYIIVITSIVSLTLDNNKSEFWISLLSACIGYILPHPTLNIKQ